MTFEWAEWGLPLVFLGAGSIGGLIVAVLLSASKAEKSAAVRQTKRTDLGSDKENAINAMRALELDGGKVSAEDFVDEKRQLLGRGTEAMRELASDKETSAPSSELLGALERERERMGEAAFQAAAAAIRGQAAPKKKGLTVLALGGLWAVGWMVALVSITLVAWQFGEEADPAMTPTPVPQSAQDPRVEKWAADLKTDPNDIDALNGLTKWSLQARDMSAAMQFNQQALQVDPKDPDARLNRAILNAYIGELDQALAELDGIIADTPHFEDARVTKGLLLLDMDRYEEAIVILEAVVAAKPNPFLEEELKRAKQQLLTKGTASVVVSGTALLDSSAIGLTGSEQVFISVKSPQGGPPLAALKVAAVFPLSFTIKTTDAIAMGGAPRPFPSEMSLTIRVDRDGNPMTKDGEPEAKLPVVMGTQGIEVTLKAP